MIAPRDSVALSQVLKASIRLGICISCAVLLFHKQVEDALHSLPGLMNVTVLRKGPKGPTYFPAEGATSSWYGSSSIAKSLEVETFDWDVTFTGLAGPQPLLEVRCS